MLHTKFREIGLLVPEKIFERFLPYMGVAAMSQAEIVSKFDRKT